MTSDNAQIRVAALYRFAAFDGPAALQGPLAKLCCSLGVKGTLLLAVRTRGDAQVQQVTEIVRAAGATDIRPVTHPDEVLTAGVSAASWTGG